MYKYIVPKNSKKFRKNSKIPNSEMHISKVINPSIHLDKKKYAAYSNLIQVEGLRNHSKAEGSGYQTNDRCHNWIM